jgi:hypothetical protein
LFSRRALAVSALLVLKLVMLMLFSTATSMSEDADDMCGDVVMYDRLVVNIDAKFLTKNNNK